METRLSSNEERRMSMVEDEPRVYEIRIHGYPSSEEALALQAPIKLLLCPDPDHAPPCEIPWSFTLAGEDTAHSTALVLGVYTSGGRAGAIKRIADQLNVHPEALRGWVERAETDDGVRPGVTSEEAARIAELEREVKELRRANAILKSASAFFAAELDRPLR